MVAFLYSGCTYTYSINDNCLIGTFSIKFKTIIILFRQDHSAGPQIKQDDSSVLQYLCQC